MLQAREQKGLGLSQKYKWDRETSLVWNNSSGRKGKDIKT